MAWPTDNEPARVPPKIQPMQDEPAGCGPALLWMIAAGVAFWALVIWLLW